MCSAVPPLGKWWGGCPNGRLPPPVGPPTVVATPPSPRTQCGLSWPSAISSEGFDARARRGHCGFGGGGCPVHPCGRHRPTPHPTLNTCTPLVTLQPLGPCLTDYAVTCIYAGVLEGAAGRGASGAPERRVHCGEHRQRNHPPFPSPVLAHIFRLVPLVVPRPHFPSAHQYRDCLLYERRRLAGALCFMGDNVEKGG
jgi:hypothetical protein